MQDPIVIWPDSDLGPEPAPRPPTKRFTVCVPCHTTIPRPAPPKSIVEDAITRELFKYGIWTVRTKEWMRRTLGGYSIGK
jgi:hypothetical protein